jgi:hypothetical protein
MPLPNLPMFPSDDTLHQQSERYRHYLDRLRGELEGQEQGISNLVEQGQLWGIFPPPAGNLIVDPGFELNRVAWLLPAGSRVSEDGSPLTGKYVLQMSSSEGYAGGFLIANVGAYTSVVTGQLIGLVGNVDAGPGTTGTANATIQFYDSTKTVVSTVVGAGVAVSTAWQPVLAKAVVPATAVYARFGFSITSLSGVAIWDDTLATALYTQTVMAESTGTVNFSSTTETIIATTPAMGPLAQVGMSGIGGVATPVTITANCAYITGVGLGGNITFRIRRTNASGTILKSYPTLLGTATFYGTAFDTAPNVTSQVWVLTAQMNDNTGGATGQHSIQATQHYL